MEEHILTLPGIIQCECPTVLSGMISLDGSKRRIVLIPCSPRITCVQIQRFTETVKFPHTRNRHLIPSGHIIVHFVKIQRSVSDQFIPLEIPFAIETQLIAVSLECSCHRISVDFHNVGILPLRKLIFCSETCQTDKLQTDNDQFLHH